MKLRRSKNHQSNLQCTKMKSRNEQENKDDKTDDCVIVPRRRGRPRKKKIHGKDDLSECKIILKPTKISNRDIELKESVKIDRTDIEVLNSNDKFNTCLTTDIEQNKRKYKKRGRKPKNQFIESALENVQTSANDLNISPCSVVLNRNDIFLEHLHSDLGFENSSNSSVGCQKKNYNISNKYKHSAEDILALLEEELSPTKTLSTGNSNLTEKDDTASPPPEPVLQCSIKEETPAGTSSNTQTLSSKNFQKSNVSNSSRPLSPTLASWLATARSSNSSEGEVSINPSVGTHFVSPSQYFKNIKKSIIPQTHSKMRDANMSTPVEPRRITRIASTPQYASSSDANCEEDLFGFENLLDPVVDVLNDVSPIINHRVPKVRHKEKVSPFCPPGNTNKNWEGLLNVSKSHLVKKTKVRKNRNARPKPHVEKDEVIDLSEIHLFEDNLPEENKDENGNDDFCFEEDQSPSKPKRNRMARKMGIGAQQKFNMEDQLPWKEIMEHELVIESV